MQDKKRNNISEKKSFITYDLIILCFLSHIFFILSAWIFKQTIKTDAYYCSYKNMNCTFQVSSEAFNIHAMTERPLEICPNGLSFDLYLKVISDMTLTAFLCFAENDSCCSINKYASIILSYICKMALHFRLLTLYPLWLFSISQSLVLSLACWSYANLYVDKTLVWRYDPVNLFLTKP